MKWVEIIELRTVDIDRALLSLKPVSLMAEVSQESELQAIKLYRHGRVETDISVHLFYDSEQAEIQGSPLGLHLASALKEFGLVNHNVWVEIHDCFYIKGKRR
jgi:hypothetical protein